MRVLCGFEGARRAPTVPDTEQHVPFSRTLVGEHGGGAGAGGRHHGVWSNSPVDQIRGSARAVGDDRIGLDRRI